MRPADHRSGSGVGGTGWSPATSAADRVTTARFHDGSVSTNAPPGRVDHVLGDVHRVGAHVGHTGADERRAGQATVTRITVSRNASAACSATARTACLDGP